MFRKKKLNEVEVSALRATGLLQDQINNLQRQVNSIGLRLDSRITALEPKTIVAWNPGYGSYVGPYVRTSTEAKLQAALAREMAAREDLGKTRAEITILSDAFADRTAQLHDAENKNTELKNNLAKASQTCAELINENHTLMALLNWPYRASRT